MLRHKYGGGWNRDRGLVLKPDGKGCFYLPKVQGWIDPQGQLHEPGGRLEGPASAWCQVPGQAAAQQEQHNREISKLATPWPKKIGEVRLRWSKHRDGRTMKIPYAPQDKLEHEFIWFLH